MEREQIKEKLKKIKALADRGVGGERETALRMYEELMKKYGIDEAETEADAIEKHWFGYKTEQEEEILTQIFYKVTGSISYYRYTGKASRRKKRGCLCTEIEAAEIKLLFDFYREELKREMEAFMIAFKYKNDLFPDETARCYEKIPERKQEYTEEEKRMRKKAGAYAMFMDGTTPPKAQIAAAGFEMEDEE